MSIQIRLTDQAFQNLSHHIDSLVTDKVASRIAAKDFTLWGKDAEAESSMRLGWVTSAIDSRVLVESIIALRDRFRAEQVDRFVLCGMGGSSLAPEVITQTAGVELIVLDSTNPDQVRAALSGDIHRTAIIVSSKSGSTVETDSQKRVFEKAFNDAGIDVTKRVVIVTDPGSPMEAASQTAGYQVFNADATVGGRYSALTAFGLVPSGLAGVDIESLLNQASEASAQLSADDASNPGLILGAVLAASMNESTKVDKVGIIADESSIVGFGDWAEQLIAESTGKLGKGVLPVVLSSDSAETQNTPTDMVLVNVVDTVSADSSSIEVAAPLGAQFLLWEYATAVASRILGINPFDQPDVESAKIAARGMLDSREPELPAAFAIGDIEVRAASLELAENNLEATLKALFSHLAADGYVSVQAYLDRTSVPQAALIRNAIASATGRPTTFGWAPRFLHSTGQYHKGGPRQGVFLQLVARSSADLPVPGREFTFGELIAAQAAGDAKVLADLGRPVLTLTLNNPADDLAGILQAIG